VTVIKPRFWTLSIVSGYKNTMFWELALLPSSGKRGGPTQLGPLERASLSHWSRQEIAYTVSPVNVAEATLVKQVDH
jgi:hypothetical protein